MPRPSSPIDASLNFKFAFVHIPTTPEHRAMWMKDGGVPGPSMEIDRIIHGVRALIEAAVIEETNNRVLYTKDRPLIKHAMKG